MKQFTFELSTKIYFGIHILEKALSEEKRFLKDNILIVTTGRSLIKNGYLDELIHTLKEINPRQKICVYDNISPNPRLEEAKEAAELGKKNQVKTVIGFGGGSAMDAAKAAAIGIGADDDLEGYLMDGKEPSGQTLPIIAIPTTAGTGSELSRGAILTSEKHHIKTGIRGKNIVPCVAIVDSYFTWTVPRKITMETGFDVLAHAIESYVAQKANPFSEMLSEKAIRLAAENIQLLYENIDDKQAREGMSFASMLMGMNLADIGTCLPHRMQYAVGAKTDTSHGAGLAALYPSWIKYEYEMNQEKIMNVLRWMEYQNVTSADEAKEVFLEFLRKIEINYTLSDLGIGIENIGILAKSVTGNLANDKLSEVPGIIHTLFCEAL